MTPRLSFSGSMLSSELTMPRTLKEPVFWNNSALMKTSKNKADAKRFLDWTLSPEAAALYGKYKEIVTIPGTPLSKSAQAAGLPADVSKVLYPMNFAASAKEREGTLATWQKTIGR